MNLSFCYPHVRYDGSSFHHSYPAACQEGSREAGKRQCRTFSPSVPATRDRCLSAGGAQEGDSSDEEDDVGDDDEDASTDGGEGSEDDEGGPSSDSDGNSSSDMDEDEAVTLAEGSVDAGDGLSPPSASHCCPAWCFVALHSLPFRGDWTSSLHSFGAP